MALRGSLRCIRKWSLLQMVHQPSATTIEALVRSSVGSTHMVVGEARSASGEGSESESWNASERERGSRYVEGGEGRLHGLYDVEMDGDQKSQ